MRGFSAVLRKEVGNFFVSPIAYAIITIYVAILGYIFTANVLYMSVLSLQASGNPLIAERINVTDFIIRPVMQNMGFLLLFVMPLLTMRLFSEEKKTGSIELLLTYPISDLAVLLGKFLAASLVLFVILLSTVPSIALLFGIGAPDIGVVLASYLGLLLMGMAFLSLGTFISSLTENQIISAVVSFGTALMFWIVSWSASITDESTGAVLRNFSILEHLESFTKGLISLPDVSYFVLFMAFFLFMTLRSLEAHRWRG